MQLQKLHSLQIVRVVFLLLYQTTNAVITGFSQEKDMPGSVAVLALEMHDELILQDISKLRSLASTLMPQDSVFRDEFSEAAYHRVIGSYYSKVGKLYDAIWYLRRSLKYFESIENYSLCAQICNDIGNCCQLITDYERADKYYKLSGEFGRMSPDDDDAFLALYNLGRMKLTLGDTLYAIGLLHNYAQQAKRKAKYVSLADVYSVLFMIADAKGENQLAEELLTKAMTFANRSESRLAQSNSAINSGISNFKKGENDLALSELRRGLGLRETLNNTHLICDANYNLGVYYLLTDETDSARFYFEKALSLALEKDLYKDAIDAIEAVMELELNTIEIERYQSELSEIEKLYQDNSKRLVEEEHVESENYNATSEGIIRLIIVFSSLIILIFLAIRREKGLLN